MAKQLPVYGNDLFLLINDLLLINDFFYWLMIYDLDIVLFIHQLILILPMLILGF